MKVSGGDERRLRSSLPGADLAAMIALAAAIVLVAIARVRMPIQRAPGDQPPPASKRPWPDLRLDLNTATAGQLAALPGIGPTLSERIVADRQANGPFASVDDLQRVPRVGPVLVSEVRAHVITLQPQDGSTEFTTDGSTKLTGEGH